MFIGFVLSLRAAYHTETSPLPQPFVATPEHFGAFFDQVARTCLERVSFREMTALLVFLDHCFNSMEVELVRQQVQRLVSLPMWICLLEVSGYYSWKWCPTASRGDGEGAGGS